MRRSTIPEYITVGKICLDQWYLFDAEAARFVLVKRPPERFQTRYDGFPRILRELVRGSGIGRDR